MRTPAGGAPWAPIAYTGWLMRGGMIRIACLGLTAVLVSCATAGHDPVFETADSAVDGGSGPDAAPPVDGAPAIDAPRASFDGGLHPDLALPASTGQACDTPGTMNECPSPQVCRHFSPDGGRCEACSPCGNLNAPCSRTDQCDTLFTCFQGHCVGFCTLGTTECGAPSDCVDVGHSTVGVCRPL